MSEGTGTEQQISFKKPKAGGAAVAHAQQTPTPPSEQQQTQSDRRSALKEYYKVKQQHQQKQQDQAAAKTSQPRGEEEDDDEEGILKGVHEIDLEKESFPTILKETNNLTTSVNLINASIKDIIYNNYYELIKLNDYLAEFNDLDAAVYHKNEKDSVLDLLNYKDTLSTGDAQSTEKPGFEQLENLMDKIVQFDSIDFTSKIKTHDESIVTKINSLFHGEHDENRDDALKKLIEQVKSVDGYKPSLVLQLESLLRTDS